MELFSGSGLAAVQFYAALLLIAFLAVRLVSFLWTSLSQKFRESAIVVNLHCNGVHAPCSYWTEKGGRPYQEDRFCMRGDTTRVKCSIYAVFDGHGGSMASQYCKENVMARIMNQPLLDENPVKAMETAILEVDREFSDKARKQNLTDGSTVLVALIHNAKI